MQRVPGDTINNFTLPFLLFFSIVEVELYTISRDLINICGRDAWLAVLLGGLGSTVALYFLTRLARRFPTQTFFEYAPTVWGNFLSYPILLLFILFWLVCLSCILWHVSNINATFFLPNTPRLVTLAFFVVGAVFLSSYGLVPISRFFELMLLFFLVPYLVIMAISLMNIKISYFFPMLEKGIWPLFKASLVRMLILQGLEIVLFAIPFARQPEKSTAPLLWGMVLVNIVVTIQVIGVIGNIGIVRGGSQIYPSMGMLGTLRIPGWPVERFEPLLTIPWLIGTFTTCALLIYLLSYGITRLLPLRRASALCWGMGLAGILLACLYPNILWALIIGKLVWLLNGIVAYLIPLLTLLVCIIRRKGAAAGP